ncbi:MAG: hypothetical protein JXA39_08420 [Bacteroidales bacterium]|nr:hypothetical protein [Bacteroidales bacterium]MBN2862047.1 hypothetical protein [Bacteroidales bacterium]
MFTIRNVIFYFFLLSIIAESVSGQVSSDSLVRFSDLKFHSEFEKEALSNFVKNRVDTFNFFLAIDEDMSGCEAEKIKGSYQGIFDDLEGKKIVNKKINRKIKLAYASVHSRFMKRYNENEYFPVIFQKGTYNCVSASMLFTMIFDRLDIPYKVMASSDHVYLVANPGSNSVVIETTNPGFEKAIFTGEFKQQYVSYLRNSKLISENELRNKSVEEIFEENFKEVREAEFINLPGIQYYNKALIKLQDNNVEDALELSQKAYFFFPENQVKTLLYTALLYHLEKCSFEKVSDIDYLAQLARFENTQVDAVVAIFSNIIVHHLQYTDREAFCDSLYHRLISQITDKKAIEEIGFNYNMQMSYRYQFSDKVEKYVKRALDIKGNYHDANIILGNYLNRKLNTLTDPYVLLDTLDRYDEIYNYEMITPMLTERRSMAYLDIAREMFRQKKMTSGDEYLKKFEAVCLAPVTNQLLVDMIERIYRVVALYYFSGGNKSKAQSYVNRGLKFVPGSDLLKYTVY